MKLRVSTFQSQKQFWESLLHHVTLYRAVSQRHGVTFHGSDAFALQRRDTQKKRTEVNGFSNVFLSFRSLLQTCTITGFYWVQVFKPHYRLSLRCVFCIMSSEAAYSIKCYITISRATFILWLLNLNNCLTDSHKLCILACLRWVQIHLMIHWVFILFFWLSEETDTLVLLSPIFPA